MIRKVISALTPPILIKIAKAILRKKSSFILVDGVDREPKEARFQGESSYNVRFHSLELEGDHFFLPEYALHRPAVQRMLKGMTQEPDTHALVRKLLTKFPGSMVHAGTFFGDMLPAFSRYVPKTVYAFEPVLENYILARLTVEKNSLENVLLFNCALSSSISNVKLDTGEADLVHYGGASKVSASGTHICATLTIDSLNIEDLAVVQLDIEGHEQQAIEGARSSIEKHQPVILIEDNNNNCKSLLESLDYHYFGAVPGLKMWVHLSRFEEIQARLES